MPKPVRRFKQPQSQSPQKIRPRGSQGRPVKFRQPNPPVRRFKKQVRKRYRVPNERVEQAERIIVYSTSWDSPDKHLHAALRHAVAHEQLTEPIIAVLVPVLGRPHRVQQLVDSFRAATSPADAALYFVAQHSDAQEVAAIRAAGFEPILVGDEDRSWARKINRGFERTTESWLLLGADDLRFHPGWVRAIRRLLRVHDGIIGTNDLGNAWTRTGVSSTHPLVRRAYANVCGTADERHRVVHEGYHHNFTDSELVNTAKRRGLYVHAVNCVIEHLHPAWGKAKQDATYRLGQSTFQKDKVLYTERGRRFGW